MAFTNPDNNVKQLKLTPGQNVVVFGSGAGGHSFAAARVLQGSGTVYAIDVRQDMLNKISKEAGEQGLVVETKLGNIEQPRGTGKQDSSVDAVIIPNTLFMYDNKKAILEEAKRIVKPGGKIQIVDWTSSFDGIGPQMDQVFTRMEATELAQTVGLEFVSDFNAGGQHYGLIYTKSGVAGTQTPQYTRPSFM